jgi:hypothetical protein
MISACFSSVRFAGGRNPAKGRHGGAGLMMKDLGKK